MQKKKIVAGITAIVVLALLFAGVGYAFSGTARTYNQGDEQALAYMSVTPADFNPIFTGDTAFDTYVYEGATPATKMTAYAFKDDSETVTVNTTDYTAVGLGSKALTVLNNTDGNITTIDVNVTATGNVGSTDFVYIFKLTGGTNDAFIVFNNVGTATFDDYAVTINDGQSAALTLTVYVGYVANVYVPTSYIGPASANQGYVASNVYDAQVTYYSDDQGTVANPQPTQDQVEAGGYFIATGLPYIQTANAPGDLAATSFSIVVTDATPAP